MELKIQKSPIKLFANPKAVITTYLNLPGKERVAHIVSRLEAMTENEIEEVMKTVLQQFGKRHRNILETFQVYCLLTSQKFNVNTDGYTQNRKNILGAFLTKEYSIQAAALFNPSIVAHPNQQALNPGELRVLISLRATGEGHISSICFQTGIVNDRGEILLDPQPSYFTSLKKNEKVPYKKAFILERASRHPSFIPEVLDALPQNFTEKQLVELLTVKNAEAETTCLQTVLEITDTNYELADSSELPINEKVIFPNARGECMGMEDLRLVAFKDDNRIVYYGTYTAYDGRNIRTQLIETVDFNVFKIRTLLGKAISDKGMALFPEKINGVYMMLARQDGENITIMSSADLYQWDSYEILMSPKYSWEMVQLGNCGSPVKTEKGWLILTHGVGMMRKYVISAILLELEDPAKIIGRLKEPILEADETEREGYVPNVVYTCGSILHDGFLIIPYAVSDSATRFVRIQLAELLKDLINSNTHS